MCVLQVEKVNLIKINFDSNHKIDKKFHLVMHIPLMATQNVIKAASANSAAIYTVHLTMYRRLIGTTIFCTAEETQP